MVDGRRKVSLSGGKELIAPAVVVTTTHEDMKKISADSPTDDRGKSVATCNMYFR